MTRCSGVTAPSRPSIIGRRMNNNYYRRALLIYIPYEVAARDGGGRLARQGCGRSAAAVAAVVVCWWRVGVRCCNGQVRPFRVCIYTHTHDTRTRHYTYINTPARRHDLCPCFWRPPRPHMPLSLPPPPRRPACPAATGYRFRGALLDKLFKTEKKRFFLFFFSLFYILPILPPPCPR